MADPNKVLSNLLTNFRQLLTAPAGSQDPLFLNTIYFRAGELAIVLRREKVTKETNRKTVQFEIRDELMSEQGMSKTAAEAEARTDPRYLAYLEELDTVSETVELAELLRDAAKQRAWLAKDERAWERDQAEEE